MHTASIHSNADCEHNHCAQHSATPRQFYGFWRWKAREGDCCQTAKSKAHPPPRARANTGWDSSKFKSCGCIYVLQCSEWLQCAEATENQVSPEAWSFTICKLATITSRWSLFPPAMETFHSGPDSLLPSFSASHMLTASSELRQLVRLHCGGCLIGFLSNSQTLPIFTWFFFFLSFLAISAWFYMLSHSDISEEILFFHWQCSVFCQLSSVLTSGDPAALGQFRGGAANLPFPTVL